MALERDFYPLQHSSEDVILYLDPRVGNACVPLLLPPPVGTVTCPQNLVTVVTKRRQWHIDSGEDYE